MPLRAYPHTLIYNTLEKVQAYWNSFLPNAPVVPDYRDKWLQQSGFFETISRHSRVCIMLFDTVVNQIIFAADETKVLGDHASQFTSAHGVDYSLGNIHADYLQAILMMQQKSFELCKERPDLLPYRMVMNWDGLYRKDTNYIHALQQVACVETNEQKEPLLFLSYIYDISHLKKNPSANLVISTPEQTFNWNYNFENRQIEKVEPFTWQENKILQLLAEGMPTKQMADALSISPHTVDTYRRRLLAKTNCVDTTALVSYARMVGFL